MQPKPNPNPAPAPPQGTGAERNGAKIIEELKAAKEEIEETKKDSPRTQAELGVQARPQTPSKEGQSPVRQQAGESNPPATRSLAGALSRKTALSERKEKEIPISLEEDEITKDKEEISLLKKIAGGQQELSQEQSVLEKRHQQIQEIEKKVAARIELLKKLQTKGTELNKEVQEYEEQLAQTKKENSSLLDQIKNSLGE